MEIVKKYYNQKWNVIIFDGYDFVKNGRYYSDYPHAMSSISHYVNNKNISTHIKYKNLLRDNYINSRDKNSNINYMIDYEENVNELINFLHSKIK